MNASSHRAAARAALKGKWVEAILTTLVYSLVVLGISFASGAVNAIPLLGLVISVVLMGVTGAFGLGYSQYCLNLVDYKPTELKQIFSRTDLLLPYCKVFLVMFGLMFGVIMAAAVVSGVLAGLLGELGIMLMAVLMIAVYVFMIMYFFGVSMVGFVLLETPGIGARAALRRSTELMKGNKFRLFCLELSFIGWAILSVFTMGIGMLALQPYMATATASFYRELVPGVVNRSNVESNPESYETYENYSYDALPSGENPIIDDDAGFTDFGGDSIDDSAIQTPGF